MRLAAHYGASKVRGRRELDALMRKTEFTKNELKLLYWGWKCACPSGTLTESTFKDIYAQFFPQAGESMTTNVIDDNSSAIFVGHSSLYAHYVYRAMFAEKARQGEVRFTDYAMALSTLSRGTTRDKLEWTFRLYDINNDGKLTLEELAEISRAIYGLLGYYVSLILDLLIMSMIKTIFNQVSPSHDQTTCEKHAQQVFKKLDPNGVGYVTLEQFLDTCAKVSLFIDLH